MFDIVNGFLIDAEWSALCAGQSAEVISNILSRGVADFGLFAAAVLLVVMWTLKCEVRASGECLGMHRR